MKKEIAICGIPRSGTTYLFRSICGLPPGPGTPKGPAYDALPALKAHSLAPPDSFGDPHAAAIAEHANTGGKCIFVFGDPVLSVISTRLKRWDHVHAANCGCYQPLAEIDIFISDCFHYQMMFESWMQPHPFPVLCVRYESIFKVRGEIEQFLGRKIAWNPWKFHRSTNVNQIPQRNLSDIQTTYSTLTRIIKEAPDIVVP